MRYLGEDDLTQVMGIGYLGEVRAGPDGNLYQWVQGVDGLGNLVGFWSALKRRARKLARRALPFAQRFAPFIPGGAAALTAATPFLRQAGITGYGGLGALYQAPDGSLYQVQGFAEDDELRGYGEDDELRGYGEDDELRGFAEDDELRGFAEDDELRGYGEDDELRGFAEDDELRGFAEDDELRGFAEDDELRGMDGYVLQDGMSGLEKFVPDEPARTRWFVPPTQPPEVWRPLW
jgi:hypothetical protein